MQEVQQAVRALCQRKQKSECRFDAHHSHPLKSEDSSRFILCHCEKQHGGETRLPEIEDNGTYAMTAHWDRWRELILPDK